MLRPPHCRLAPNAAVCFLENWLLLAGREGDRFCQSRHTISVQFSETVSGPDSVVKNLHFCSKQRSLGLVRGKLWDVSDEDDEDEGWIFPHR